MTDDRALADVDFILSHAERLVKVATMCVVSFGLAEGLNDALRTEPADRDQWKQAAAGLQDGVLMMAALRSALLLDADESKVSFQAIYRRLKENSTREELVARLSSKHGLDDIFPPSRESQIEKFMLVYSEINWAAHSRLTHFRNLGIAHLTIQKMSKSITFDELKEFVSIISRLAIILQQLCHTSTALQEWMLEDYRETARDTFLAALGVEKAPHQVGIK